MNHPSQAHTEQSISLQPIFHDIDHLQLNKDQDIHLHFSKSLDLMGHPIDFVEQLEKDIQYLKQTSSQQQKMLQIVSLYKKIMLQFIGQHSSSTTDPTITNRHTLSTEEASLTLKEISDLWGKNMQKDLSDGSKEEQAQILALYATIYQHLFWMISYHQNIYQMYADDQPSRKAISEDMEKRQNQEYLYRGSSIFKDLHEKILQKKRTGIFSFLSGGLFIFLGAADYTFIHQIFLVPETHSFVSNVSPISIGFLSLGMVSILMSGIKFLQVLDDQNYRTLAMPLLNPFKKILENMKQQIDHVLPHQSNTHLTKEIYKSMKGNVNILDRLGTHHLKRTNRNITYGWREHQEDLRQTLMLHQQNSEEIIRQISIKQTYQHLNITTEVPIEKEAEQKIETISSLTALKI